MCITNLSIGRALLEHARRLPLLVAAGVVHPAAAASALLRTTEQPWLG